MKDKYSKKLKVNVVLDCNPPNMAESSLDLVDLNYVIGTSFLSGLFYIGLLKPGPLKVDLHPLTTGIRRKEISCLPDSAACQRLKLNCESVIESMTMATGMGYSNGWFEPLRYHFLKVK